MKVAVQVALAFGLLWTAAGCGRLGFASVGEARGADDGGADDGGGSDGGADDGGSTDGGGSDGGADDGGSTDGGRVDGGAADSGGVDGGAADSGGVDGGAGDSGGVDGGLGLDGGITAGATVWATAFGARFDDVAFAIATDSSSNALVTGYFNGTLDFGDESLTNAGNLDAYVLSLAPDQSYRWARRLGGPGADVGYGIATDRSGNVLATGYFHGAVDFGGGPLMSAGTSDIFVVSLAPDGSFRWARRFGGPGGELGFAISTDPGGGVLVTGHFNGMVDFGGGPLTSAGNFDVFVLSLSSDGGFRWARRFGSTGIDDAHGIAADASGNVYVAGRFFDSVDFGGGALTSQGNFDVFVLSLGPDGAYRWARRFGGTESDIEGNIAVDRSGNAVVTGTFIGTVDFGGGDLISRAGQDIFVLSLDMGGNYRWARRFGGAGADNGSSVATDAVGNVRVTGVFSDAVDFGGGSVASVGSRDIFALGLLPGGGYAWARGFGSTSSDSGNDIATDGSGHVLIAATIAGSTDFGAGPLTGGGGRDLVVLKLE